MHVLKMADDLTNREKNFIAAVAGTAAAIVSNPFEVVLVSIILLDIFG